MRRLTPRWQSQQKQPWIYRACLQYGEFASADLMVPPRPGPRSQGFLLSEVYGIRETRTKGMWAYLPQQRLDTVGLDIPDPPRRQRLQKTV